MHGHTNTKLRKLHNCIMSVRRCRTVGIVPRLRAQTPKNRSDFPDRDKNFIASPKHTDFLWGTARFIFKGYRGPFAGSKVAQTSNSPLVSF